MSSHNKEFLELQAKWYKKLEQSGFSDIEQNDDNPGKVGGNLKTWSGSFMANMEKTSFEDKQRYFELAGQFLHEYKFEDSSEKRVWELHSQGLSIREIARAIKKKSLAKDSVFRIIKKLKDLMFVLYGVKK